MLEDCETSHQVIERVVVVARYGNEEELQQTVDELEVFDLEEGTRKRAKALLMQRLVRERS